MRVRAIAPGFRRGVFKGKTKSLPVQPGEEFDLDEKAIKERPGPDGKPIQILPRWVVAVAPPKVGKAKDGDKQPVG